ncbi:DNA-binding domain-containing protein [Iodobacter sp. CM08]|uniref:DNA-binding domain-containing protein n=1 Tax=Iodobacter sp. CM08 TaxID=3085902 RepID=UPI002980D6B5|nr:DNA-binding domain-containing protein [Iodobacter sp. CM08]MDW5417807.1 DNA-binding domain-containing protein [Iodobacter sp. CM08]
MNYANALKNFSQIFKQPHYLPSIITVQSQPYLDVYRNNVLANRSANLASSYPTIVQLVGGEFFTALASEYIAETSATSGNLHDDGVDFPAFLSVFPHVADLPYLSDVARLDWAIHQAHYSIDLAPIDISQLQSYTPEQFGQLKLLLHPACAVIRSASWPIYQILMMHHGESPADLQSGGEQAWVWRDHWQTISSSDALFLEHLLAGDCIETAMLASHDDSSPILAQLFNRGLVYQIHR